MVGNSVSPHLLQFWKLSVLLAGHTQQQTDLPHLPSNAVLVDTESREIKTRCNTQLNRNSVVKWMEQKNRLI